MKILVPDYLLESILRHYRTLAEAYQYDGNIKAINAKRMSGKEIQKLLKILKEQKRE